MTSPTVTTTTTSSIPPHIPKLWEAISIGVGLAILTLAIVVANFVVLRVYFRNRCLQVPKHFHLVSLAVADLLVGLAPVNLFTGYVISGKWPFGGKLCSVWLSLDHILFTVSNVSVIAIAFDRYFCICHPVFHHNRMKGKSTTVWAIVLTWAVSFLIWAPAIIIYPRVNKVVFDPYRCKIIFYQHDLLLTSLVVIFSFIIPVFTLVCFYTAVFRKISFMPMARVTPMIQLQQQGVQQQRKQISGSKNRIAPNNKESILPTGPKTPITASSTTCSYPGTSSIEGRRFSSIEGTVTSTHTDIADSGNFLTPSSAIEARRTRRLKSKRNNPTTTKRETSTAAQGTTTKIKQPPKKRASTVLLLVTVAFTLCWLPYHVAVLIEAGTNYSFSDGLWHLCYVVGKFNSLLNPFCYAIGHRKFRQGFKDILMCFTSSTTQS